MEEENNQKLEDDEKVEAIRFSLSSFLLVIAIIIICIMGVLLYISNRDKRYELERIESLSSDIGELKNSIASINQSQIEEISTDEQNDIISQTSNKIVNLDDIEIPKNSTNIYKKLETEDISFLYVIEAIENTNNTYTLNGVAYSVYTLTNEQIDEISEAGKIKLYGKYYDVVFDESEQKYILTSHSNEKDETKIYIEKDDELGYYLSKDGQFTDVWKITNNFYTVEVSANIVCEEDFTKDKTTAQQEFQFYKTKEPTDPLSPEYGRCYKFIQKNGKVTSIEKVILGV